MRQRVESNRLKRIRFFRSQSRFRLLSSLECLLSLEHIEYRLPYYWANDAVAIRNTRCACISVPRAPLPLRYTYVSRNASFARWQHISSPTVGCWFFFTQFLLSLAKKLFLFCQRKHSETQTNTVIWRAGPPPPQQFSMTPFQSMPDQNGKEPTALLDFAHCLDYTVIHCYTLQHSVVAHNNNSPRLTYRTYHMLSITWEMREQKRNEKKNC